MIGTRQLSSAKHNSVMARCGDGDRLKGLTMEEAREFIQEQLQSMEANNISNKELEAYTHGIIYLS